MYRNIKKQLFSHSAKFILLLSIIFTKSAFALPNDSEQPLHIVANSTTFNYKTGVDIYEGDVKADQGTTHLTADRLVTEKDDHHKIVSVIAYGVQKSAEFTTLPTKSDQLMHANARVIKFYPVTSVVVLEENVIVTQGKNSFHGPHIIYNMKDQIVSAPASKNGRASIVIEPNKQTS